MAITAYTGVPGSGKSYALMAMVILPGLQAGRRVLTNLAGIDADKVRQYVNGAGELVLFTGEQTLAPGFFPDEDTPDAPSVLKPGDLMVFDEVRISWNPSGKLDPAILKFLRYHRHFVSSDGQSTDVVLATQMLTDLHRDYKGCVERNYKFKKMNTLGLNNRYVWNMWEGAVQRRGEQIANGNGSYDPAVFALYSSYIGGVGKEVKTDKRSQVVSIGKVVIYVMVAVVIFGGAAWAVSRVFKVPKQGGAVASGTANNIGVVGAAGSPVAGGAARSNTGAPPVSVRWRIAGVITAGNLNVVVVLDPDGNSRYERPENFESVEGRPFAGMIDGERVLAIGNSLNGGAPGVAVNP